MSGLCLQASGRELAGMMTIVLLLGSLILLVLVLTAKRRQPPPTEVCAVCGGARGTDAICNTCKQPIHTECWDRHLCKYRIN